ncbi:MAG: hypothetical protein ACE5K4_09680 [Candidatus Hydrothermarchaeota archaeon]
MEISAETKLRLVLASYAGILSGMLFSLKEKYDNPDNSLELYKEIAEERARLIATTIAENFGIKGNDALAIGKCWNVWMKVHDFEFSMSEQSKTRVKLRITKCPFQQPPRLKDIGQWDLLFLVPFSKALNPNAIAKRPLGMCAGDPNCELIIEIPE